METICAPASLLIKPRLSASAKVVWLASRLTSPRSPTALQAACGLSPKTIRKALAELSEAPYQHQPGETDIPIPARLLAERQLGAQAKLVYTLLQSHRSPSITYEALSRLANTSLNTVKLAVSSPFATPNVTASGSNWPWRSAGWPNPATPRERSSCENSSPSWSTL